ncbi:VOC family protein [Haloarchaeobius baliensis]|uniref:VOC family protein n=1 Tax=Haloarchaeobius baliensis TaxID=1670458 RepID=UPI003F8814F7
MSTLTGLTYVTVLVDDQDEALEFYTDTLGFEVRSDDPMPGEDGRWITVGFPGTVRS